ncbi:hypothetical protein [Roseibium polysiphoniae]|uniref:Uncharacterized protein n=1 Tax=Roseibium polysiphoniae TaxID=2571221 RepID=A0ABR9C6A3_9HYPH|nr:hypothetical protein [Roseibium polysiphoniae]MBD8875412.1 hypothetical protein [Roseibium polysiphoniae]
MKDEQAVNLIDIRDAGLRVDLLFNEVRLLLASHSHDGAEGYLNDLF